MLLFGSQLVHARGFGGAHASGSSGSYHGSSYHGGSSSAQTYHSPNGATAVHGSEGTAAKGPEGNVYTHPDSSGSTYHGAEGTTAIRNAMFIRYA